jgi:8-oxo-dGTP pyrophosphatase MutT (NUDIX family)
MAGTVAPAARATEGLSSVAMRWTVHGERSLYDSEWVGLHLADVELPDGERFEHHLIRAPMPAAGVVVMDGARGVLMLWRHRFITDTWGWEIPAGKVEPGESISEAAAREVLEETGWRPGPLEPLTAYHPTNGLSDQTFHLFMAAGATEVGPPTDPHEAERIAWVPVAELVDALRAGAVRDGLSLTALCWCLAFGLLSAGS